MDIVRGMQTYSETKSCIVIFMPKPERSSGGI